MMQERVEFEAIASQEAEAMSSDATDQYSAFRDPFIRWDNSFMTVGEVGIPVNRHQTEQINPNGYSFDTDPFIRRDNPFMRVERSK